jgi:hypothetical protein
MAHLLKPSLLLSKRPSAMSYEVFFSNAIGSQVYRFSFFFPLCHSRIGVTSSSRPRSVVREPGGQLVTVRFPCRDQPAISRLVECLFQRIRGQPPGGDQIKNRPHRAGDTKTFPLLHISWCKVGVVQDENRRDLRPISVNLRCVWAGAKGDRDGAKGDTPPSQAGLKEAGA